MGFAKSLAPDDRSPDPASRSGRTAIELVESGVPNLDFVLGGGLVSGSLTMVIGSPGCGKTILSQQLAFYSARHGRKVLVLTTLPEPHVKLLSNLRTLDFFDERLLGERIELLNVYRQLREDFANAGTTIVRMVRESRATMLIIDSFDSVRDLAGSEIAIKELVYELSAGLGMLGVTVVIVSAFEPDQAARYPELTIADHVIVLRSEAHGARGMRSLEVSKMRGAGQRTGRHSYQIGSAGLRVFPRQESVPLPPEAALGVQRVPFGLAELDAMMGGGPTPGSTTLLVGSPGVGKSLLALRFLLNGHQQDQRGLYVSFHETEQQVVAKAAGLGVALPVPLSDAIAFLHRVPAEFDADELATIIREQIGTGQIGRLVIDGVNELLGGLVDKGRQLGFLTALTAYLRNAGVTACYVEEMSTAASAMSAPADIAFSAYSDNIVLLRRLGSKAVLHHTISILKMRNSDHDRTIREFTIGAGGVGGLTILPPSESTSDVLDALGSV